MLEKLSRTITLRFVFYFAVVTLFVHTRFEVKGVDIFYVTVLTMYLVDRFAIAKDKEEKQ